jgi:hypothetical protein
LRIGSGDGLDGNRTGIKVDVAAGLILIGIFSIDLYSDVDDIQISKEPFLYGQVVDNTGESIRWEVIVPASKLMWLRV